MPTAAIEVRCQYSREEELGLINAVQAAMIDTLKVPHWTTSIRLFVHEPHRFMAPPGKGERYTLVAIDCFVGRSVDTKGALYQAMVRNLGLCGIPADHLKVLVRESPRENWGIRGGLPASGVALGYDVNF